MNYFRIGALVCVLTLFSTMTYGGESNKQVTTHPDHLVFHPQGEANDKHIVLIAGDEEYRSEEAMPMMAEILARHGFKCTVLFSMSADGKPWTPMPASH